MVASESTSGEYPNVLRAVLAQPWAIDHDSLAWAAIVDVLALRSIGRGLTDDEISARIEAAQNGPRRGGGRSAGSVGIATIPIYGVITPRGNMMARSSGGTTAESILQDFRGALADPDVDGIVFDMDSPGGAVEGIDELTSEIRAARGQKPIVAVANYTAASAAYWIASAADEIVASPSAMVGAIGVFTAHDDISEAQAKLGVKRTVIAAGKHKAEGALGQPMSDEARAHVQGQVDDIYGVMTSAIAKGRSYNGRTVSPATVRGETYGEGRGVLAKKALAAGMVDRIATLEDTIRRVARDIQGSQRRAGAVDDTEGLAALASGLMFNERVALIEGLADHTEIRAALRAEEGRRLSEADRGRLKGLGDRLLGLAGMPDEPEDEEPEGDDVTPPTGDWRSGARVALELAMAELN